jgi:hypothetical protein
VMDLTSSGFRSIENGLPKFCTHGIHGFEGEVLEDFLAEGGRNRSEMLSGTASRPH